MTMFAYEEKEQYETYEWDNVWIDHADDLSLKRVLYIGDSISCGMRHVATSLTENKILFDGFGTSKSLDNPYFKDAVKLFAKQESRRDAVIFNNGLHGWHLDDNEYSYHYEEMLKFLLSEFKNTPIVIILTTHISNKERNKQVVSRNNVAKKLADKYGLPVIDLYTLSLEKAELLSSDGVHFVNEGYTLFAKTLIQSLLELLPDINA